MKNNSPETITYAPEHPYEKHYQLKEGDIYVEAGALVGRYGYIATKKNCRTIVLIEPSPESADSIQYGIDHGILSPNTILIRKAISNKKGIGLFSIEEDSAGHKLINNHSFNLLNFGINPNNINVDTDTLDNILTELKIDHVDLLSCDCEGCELNLVKSAKKYFETKKIKNFALCIYHVGDDIKIEIENLIRNYGCKDIIVDKEQGMIFGHE